MKKIRLQREKAHTLGKYALEAKLEVINKSSLGVKVDKGTNKDTIDMLYNKIMREPHFLGATATLELPHDLDTLYVFTGENGREEALIQGAYLYIQELATKQELLIGDVQAKAIEQGNHELVDMIDKLYTDINTIKRLAIDLSKDINMYGYLHDAGYVVNWKGE